jgi:hypothetical protein
MEKLDYNVATEEVSKCIKVMNHPFYNYWLNVIGISILMGIVIGGLVSWVLLIILNWEELLGGI